MFWASSTGCTCISELMSTPGLELSTVRFKHHPSLLIKLVT
ncbi:unnamed protein product [Schistosoma margrebowiei]|uniref:Uncharacterized protein n=1 Tax=Schistosoma margrebowiei TaxID=48269 RepID=A0A3P8CBE7_9TREM|nr:unnamed protein product [Schistosoma margrebowiei]